MSVKVINLPLKIDGIYDIQPPSTPGLSGPELSLIIISVVVLLSISVFFYWKIYFSAKKRNVRKIKRLQKSLNYNLYEKKDKRRTIYLLCDYLKRGLKLKQINNKTSLPPALLVNQENKDRWYIFTSQLSDLRYKFENDFELEPIIKESLYWLKIWPGKFND